MGIYSQKNFESEYMREMLYNYILYQEIKKSSDSWVIGKRNCIILSFFGKHFDELYYF